MKLQRGSGSVRGIECRLIHSAAFAQDLTPSAMLYLGNHGAIAQEQG